MMVWTLRSTLPKSLKLRRSDEDANDLDFSLDLAATDEDTDSDQAITLDNEGGLDIALDLDDADESGPQTESLDEEADDTVDLGNGVRRDG